MRNRYKDDSPWFKLKFQHQCIAAEDTESGDEWAHRQSGKHVVVYGVNRRTQYVYLKRPDGGRDTKVRMHYFAYDYYPSPVTYERICTVRVPRFAYLE